MNNHEQWKPVPKYESYYEVSSHGQVRSKDRILTSGQPRKGKMLKQSDINSGYKTVSLWKANKNKNFLVHRLVLHAFTGECPPQLTVHHIDGDKHNNHVDNLKYVTQSKNNKLAYKDGLKKPSNAHGESNPFAKLTADNVKKIRKLYDSGEKSQRELARMFGVSRSTIKPIVQRKKWKHIKD